MRIHTRVVTDWNGNVLEDEFYEYDGPVAEAKGGSAPSTSTTSTTQKQEPWDKQQPYLLQGMEAAKKEFESSKPEFYPGSTVVPYSPEQEAALSLKTAQATDPNSLVNMAGDETAKTMRGDYYAPGNPAFDALMDSSIRAVRPGVDTGFTAAGRSGTSPLHSEALARGISTAMMPYMAAERDRQYRSSLDAGTTSQYAPNLLTDVGGAREAMGKNILQEDIDRWNFEQSKDAAKIADYMGLISGNYGGSTQATTTQPLFSNKGQSIAGGAAGGGALLSGIGSVMGSGA